MDNVQNCDSYIYIPSSYTYKSHFLMQLLDVIMLRELWLSIYIVYVIYISVYLYVSLANYFR
jgi:hypothetical protein